MRKQIPEVIKSKIIEEFNNTTQTQLELANKYKIGLSTVQLILRKSRLEMKKPTQNYQQTQQIGGNQKYSSLNLNEELEFLNQAEQNLTQQSNKSIENETLYNQILKDLN